MECLELNNAIYQGRSAVQDVEQGEWPVHHFALYEIYGGNKNQPPNSLVMIVAMICFTMCMPEI